MRRYDDPVEVRKGMVGRRGRSRGPSSSCGAAGCGRCATCVAHWVETGPWWQSARGARRCSAPTTPDAGERAAS